MLFFSQIHYDCMIQEKKTIELQTSKAWLTLIFKESAASVPEPILLFRIRRFPKSWSPPSPSKSSRQILTKKMWRFDIVVTFWHCCDIFRLLWHFYIVVTSIHVFQKYVCFFVKTDDGIDTQITSVSIYLLELMTFW